MLPENTWVNCPENVSALAVAGTSEIAVNNMAARLIRRMEPSADYSAVMSLVAITTVTGADNFEDALRWRATGVPSWRWPTAAVIRL
jgi:hypothetical protein